MVRKLTLAVIALCAFALGACNTSHIQSAFADGVTLSNRTTLQIGEYRTDVTFPGDIDGKALWTGALKRRLADRRVLADPGDPDAIMINARVTSYQRGNPDFAASSPQDETRLVMVVTLTQHGHEIGTVNANRTKCCGLVTANAWQSIFEDVAEQVEFEIEKRMGTDS